MLKRQKHRPEFTGDIEAKLLKSWHVELFRQVKPKQIFFAYDTPNDMPLLEYAVHLYILRIGISFYLNDKLTKSYKLHLSSSYEVITH